VANAMESEEVSAGKSAWENVSAAAAAFAASKSASDFVSRPGVPCSTSTGTGTRVPIYAALNEDVSARVSSKYLGGAAVQTLHSADWAVAPVLEQVQTHTQQAAPANKGLGNWPVVPAPLRTSDGVTAKLTMQQGKNSTGSGSSTLQNVLMSDVDVIDDLTTVPTRTSHIVL